MAKIRVTQAHANGSNVRTVPSVTGRVLGVVRVGDEGVLHNQANNWYDVEVGNLRGWVAGGQAGGTFDYAIIDVEESVELPPKTDVVFPPEFLLDDDAREQYAIFLEWMASLLRNHPYGQDE